MTGHVMPLPAVVLDVVDPSGELPDYCCHGKTPCYICGDWCWLGHRTVEVVKNGEALPICLPCANKYIPQGAEKLGRIQDHLRADGPHE